MYKILKYPDGTSYVSTYAQETETFKVNNYSDLWQLGQMIDAKNSIGVRPTVLIPNLIDAQADRRFSVSQSSGLRLVLKFLNSLKANFVIFHPHNPEVVEAIMDNVTIMKNSLFLGDVIKSINPDNPEEALILMSTDAGGFKPLMKSCDDIDWKGEVYSASKSRSYEGGATKLVQQVDRQDFGGKDVLIVDDICVGGGTFIGLSKLLKERNVGKIFLAISHMSLPELNSPELYQSFDKVFTTNSKYDEYFCKIKDGWIKPDNLEVHLMFKSTKDV